MQNKSIPVNTWLLTAACFFAFFLFGFTDNLKGPTLAPMLAELNINYGTGGNIFFSQYVGFLIATLITGILADRFGLKLVIVSAGICLFIGVSGYSALKTAALLSASLFIIGLGLGAFELGPNATIVNLFKEKKGLYLNLMGVMHGLGATLSPLFAGWLLNQGTLWRTVYRWDLVLIAIFILFAIFLRFPKTEEKSSLDFKGITKIAFKDQMPLYYFIIMLYVAAEVGFASWVVIYLQDIKGISIAFSSQLLAIFFALIMVGRLLGGFFVQRFGYLRSILIASFISTLCIGIGIFTNLYYFLPLTGFFFSIMFPTITAAVSDTHHEKINTLLGVLFTFAGLGGVIGPWIVAWASEIFGLQIGFSIILALTLLMAVCIFILFRKNNYEQNT